VSGERDRVRGRVKPSHSPLCRQPFGVTDVTGERSLWYVDGWKKIVGKKTVSTHKERT